MADLRMTDINRAAPRRASPAPQQQHRRQLPNIALLTSDEANQIHDHKICPVPASKVWGRRSR
jgi:hypothetical protein